jgi:competence protein ComEC
MAGIAFINPWLQKFWPRGKSRTNIPRKIWESASVSISCQLTTGPFAWYYFGSLPTNFLLTNLIAMPLVGLIIPASILIITLSGLGICPNLLIMFTEQLITIMTSSLKAIAEI